MATPVIEEPLGYQEFYELPADAEFVDTGLPELAELPLEGTDEDDTL